MSKYQTITFYFFINNKKVTNKRVISLSNTKLSRKRTEMLFSVDSEKKEN